jgi:hypothetical protein
MEGRQQGRRARARGTLRRVRAPGTGAGGCRTRPALMQAGACRAGAAGAARGAAASLFAAPGFFVQTIS